MTDDNFWEHKSLAEMSPQEWESVCDGCGQCCLHKLEDEDSGAIALTNVACRFLDLGTCQCGDYSNRKTIVPDCIQLTPASAETLPWLPETCGYRLLATGQPLAWWHPWCQGIPTRFIEPGSPCVTKLLTKTRWRTCQTMSWLGSTKTTWIPLGIKNAVGSRESLSLAAVSWTLVGSTRGGLSGDCGVLRVFVSSRQSPRGRRRGGGPLAHVSTGGAAGAAGRNSRPCRGP